MSRELIIKLKEKGLREVVKSDLIEGFEYNAFSFKDDSWHLFIYPDKPKTVNCPLELAMINTKI